MAWTAAARNSATKTTSQAAASSISATLTVTATVAGDLCVVGIWAGSGATSITPPAGAGFVQVLGNNSFGMWASKTVPAGTTSLTFTASGGSTLTQMGLVYGAWAGGGAYAPLSEGSSGVVSGGSPPALPSVTSSGHTIPGDLAIWLGLGDLATAAPSNPSGTGTWTSVNTALVSGQFGMRMSAQVDASTGNQVASGSTSTSAFATEAGVIAFPPQQGNFLALFPNNRR